MCDAAEEWSADLVGLTKQLPAAEEEKGSGGDKETRRQGDLRSKNEGQ